MYLPGYDHLLFRVCFYSIVKVCGWEEAQPKNLNANFIYLFLRGCHNLHVAETMSPIISVFAEIMSPMYFWSFWEPIAETLLFWMLKMLVKPYGFWLKLRVTILDALHRFREVPHEAPFKSKDLGWFARFRIQFLLDHYNDPFLSSVIPMVAPTWCHRAS